MNIASVDVKDRDKKRCYIDTKQMQLLLTIGLACMMQWVNFDQVFEVVSNFCDVFRVCILFLRYQTKIVSHETVWMKSRGSLVSLRQDQQAKIGFTPWVGTKVLSYVRINNNHKYNNNNNNDILNLGINTVRIWILIGLTLYLSKITDCNSDWSTLSSFFPF